MLPEKNVTNVTNVTNLVNKGVLSVTKCDICDVTIETGFNSYTIRHNVTQNVTTRRPENQSIAKNVTL